jgi:hypothetical protein
MCASKLKVARRSSFGLTSHRVMPISRRSKIEALAERHGRTVMWRPFTLGAAFKVTGAQGLSRTPLKREYAWHASPLVPQDPRRFPPILE